MQVRPPDDYQLPRASPCHKPGHSEPMVVAIADDLFDKRETPTRLAQQRLDVVAILHLGRMHTHVQQQAKRVDKDVTLATEHLLARVKHRDQANAPFYGAISALGIDDGRGRARFPACLLAASDVKLVMDALDRAIPLPKVQIVPNSAARRQIRRQRVPLAASGGRCQVDEVWPDTA